MAFVYEFLYRGNADPAKCAWHVVLGATQDDGLGGSVTNLKGPLNMQQAEAAGFDLATVVASLNTSLGSRADGLAAEVTALNAQVDALKDSLLEAQEASVLLQQELAAAVAAQSPAPPDAG